MTFSLYCVYRLEELVNQWIWRQDFWLPPGVTWKDIADGASDGSRYPVPRDLLICLPLALGFIALRFVFERVVALPLSRWLGVRDRVWVHVTPVPKLEAFYLQKKKQPSQNDLVVLEKHCGLTQRQIQTWLRQRRNQDRPSNTRKFCEASWRFVFYLIAFSAGLISLINTSWFWDHRECWHGYPRQAVAEAQYWYYIMELSFYLSLLLCVSVDIKRKDFKEQIIHHIATIFLIAFSYCANYVRVGTLVMLVHDSSDFLLESAKMFNYAGWRKTCDALFVIFAAVFLLTRLVVFPCRVIYTAVVDSLDVFLPYSGYYFLNGLLLVLQALHIFWAWLILRMVHKFVFLGKVERDERSDEESEVDEDEVGEEECSREQKKGAFNSKLASLANNCVLNNLTNQRRKMNSRMPKAR
ncbi:ceramide synthase 4a isoform X1 [Rhinichthys klamathensis goyatoka]|uniref:ceramide synthase 4a isoform X1 n=1 Tax=Rhinichthys klamathensis goyatoka TaxID=3034132 RepID=UPI0024B56DD3|nr:ceramide synthase 4a isoform X1 [Rhinichthys klamathensis goyatoka]